MFESGLAPRGVVFEGSLYELFLRRLAVGVLQDADFNCCNRVAVAI